MKHISKGTPKKADIVTELTDNIARAKTIIITEYQGIKHKQLEELRRTLKKSNAEFMVTKNRLLKRALGDKLPGIETLLEQPTATLFAYADEVAPLKEMLKFFKVATFGKPKGGLIGNSPLTEEEVMRLATLPSKELLLGKLVRQLNSPIQGLHYALQWNLNKLVWGLEAVKNKKTN